MINVCLLCLLARAAWTDIRTGQISNRLIASGLVLGLIRNLYFYGLRGIFFFLLQVSIPVITFYLLFLMHTLGAGDIKLFSVISTVVGLEGFINVGINSFLVGAAISLSFMLYHKNLYARLTYFANYLKTCLYTNSIAEYDSNSDGKKNEIHFSVAILAGVLLYLL